MVSAITLTVLVCVMLSLSVYLTLLVFVGVIAMLFVTKHVGGRSARYFIQHQRSFAKLEGYVEEMMNGQKVVKVFCHEPESREKFDKINEEFFEDAKNANKYSNILIPILANIGNILYVCMAFAGGMLVIYDVKGLFGQVASVAAVATMLNMTRQFTQNVSQISQQTNAIVMALAGADRIFTLMDEESEIDDGYVTLVNAREDENGELHECTERTGIWAWKHPHSADGSVTYTKLMGDVRFTEVDFSYDGEHDVLHNVTLYAEPGQKVAFVGATGAGKTTITNLINRFYDIADGKIRYDGININKIKKDDLRRSLGIVLQDTNLFTGSVMDNIRYGRLDATDEECIEAAKLANAHDFITRLPNGYNTMLNSNGANLSQGQRQLISIARAAVADPPVMILDEATSSIDTRTEALVQAGMDSLMKGRTVFVIAHRLSTVQNSDVIMVLDHGVIIERGSHEQLIAEKGKYYQLYTGAFELE
jgi:ATP-binding cassette subfamily B protein